jgi:hypothetical protein
MNAPLLFDCFRSSARYRVTIALNLYGADYTAIPDSQLTGEHRAVVIVNSEHGGEPK